MSRAGVALEVEVLVEDLAGPWTLHVECPYCGAGVRQACRSAKTPGNTTASMHSDRFTAARKAARDAVVAEFERRWAAAS